VDLGDIEILDPQTHPDRKVLARYFYDARKRKGTNWADARYFTRVPDRFAALMLETGRVDGMVCGIGRGHPHVMQALLQTIPLRAGVNRVCGMYIILTRDDILFFADCTAQIDPTAEHLAQTALMTAKAARYFDVTPKVAMLSFSNFGSVRHPEAEKVRRAVELIHEQDPSLCVDGEMQVDTALSKEVQDELFPFCELKGRANVLIFPHLAAGLIGAKLVTHLANADRIGPLTLGFRKPVNVLYLSCTAQDVVNATAITVIECLDGTL
jgi:malate dehydrogenase (oxaloacetate-decarboxylating)(NADP+)